MFVDKAIVLVKAGDGGNGGDVVFVASRNENTLVNFRYQRELKAESGGAGGKRRKHGRSTPNLLVKVPIGTVITDEKGTILADLSADGQQATIAKGGKGGFGNAHFVSSRRQAPRVAEKGEPGDALGAHLELKMIADVGLVGLPNAGKSTLLSVISNARPEIANYPFTTLVPNLGVVDVDGETSVLFADIPGLIEGAAEGKGLGDEFLRHVERTAVLVHLIDAYQEDVVETYETIQNELGAYRVDLESKPQIVALTKIEGLDEEIVKDQLSKLKAVAPKGAELMAISAQSKQGIPQLLRKVRSIVEAERAQRVEEVTEESELPVLTFNAGEDAWSVAKDEEDGVFVVTGAKIERFASRTHFDSEEGVQRLRDIMRRMGILHELVRQGINPGDTIRFGNKSKMTY
ncbi:MAG TPA: GTPase ObgE [Candidatus Saccharimonadales bacterium]